MNTENQQSSRTIRTMKDYFVLSLKGFAMGASDIVPGVSGGTMAFILGIYEELINSIRDILSPTAVNLAVRFKIKEAFSVLPWRFLLAVALGVLVAIFSLASYLEWLLINQPVYLWSFFFGLVLASIFTVRKQVRHWGPQTLIGAILGAVFAWFLVGMVPAQTPDAYWFLFLSGFIASCAMILPGISGSFILVLLGKYQYVLGAVTNRDIVILFVVALGVGVGLVTIAQVLSRLFESYHDVTIAVLIGLMAGSLRKIWPWKETLDFIIDRHGEPIPTKQINILPPEIFSSEVALALTLAIIAFVLVLGLEYGASRKGSDVEAVA